MNITRSIEDLFNKGPIETVKKVTDKVSESVKLYVTDREPISSIILISVGVNSMVLGILLYFNSLELAGVGAASLAVGLIPRVYRSVTPPSTLY